MIKKWWFLPLVFMIFTFVVVIILLSVFSSVGNAILVGSIMLVQAIVFFITGYNSNKEENK